MGPNPFRKLFNTDVAVILVCFVFLLLSYVALLPNNNDPESIVDPFFYLMLYSFFFAALNLCVILILWKRGVFSDRNYGKYVAFETSILNLSTLLMGFFYLYMGNKGVYAMLDGNTEWYACL